MADVSEALEAFLREAEAEYEKARRVELDKLVGVKEPHLRKFGNVMSVHLGLAAKERFMRSVPENLLDATERPYAQLLGLIQSHNKFLANVTEETAAIEDEIQRGREIARRNAQVGLDRAEQQIEAELARHELALATLTSPEAVEAEHAKHAKKSAELVLKAEGALAALAAVSD